MGRRITRRRRRLIHTRSGEMLLGLLLWLLLCQEINRGDDDAHRQLRYVFVEVAAALAERRELLCLRDCRFPYRRHESDEL